MMQGFGGGAAPQEQTQQPAPAPGGGAQQMDQREYDRFVGMATMAIFDEKFLPKVVDMMKKGGALPQSIAKVAVTVVGRIYEAAKGQGQQIDPQVIIMGGAAIIEKLAELAGKAGLPVEEDTVEMAFYIAADMFRTHLATIGDYTDENAEADMQAFIEAQGQDAFDQAMQKSQRALSMGMPQMPGGPAAMPEEQQQ